MTRLKKDDVWRERAMTREKRSKKHHDDALLKQHDATTRRQKYDACPALVFIKTDCWEIFNQKRQNNRPAPHN